MLASICCPNFYIYQKDEVSLLLVILFRLATSSLLYFGVVMFIVFIWTNLKFNSINLQVTEFLETKSGYYKFMNKSSKLVEYTFSESLSCPSRNYPQNYANQVTFTQNIQKFQPHVLL